MAFLNNTWFQVFFSWLFLWRCLNEINDLIDDFANDVIDDRTSLCNRSNKIDDFAIDNWLIVVADDAAATDVESISWFRSWTAGK